MTTQDLTKGIDITGLETVSGSEMDQLVDVARVAVDKGLVLFTTDTGVGVPDVPNPDVADGMGITPVWWKRYVWVRIPNAADGIGQAFAYVWNPNLASNATYLRWQNVGQRGIDAYILASMAGVDATNAQTTANTALTNSSNAVNQAANALAKAVVAEDTAEIAQQTADEAKTAINSSLMTGELKLYCGSAKTFSDTEDQGWLEASGQPVNRTTFAALFGVIGVTFGGGDGSTTFNVPDLRGRVPIGAGIGDTRAPTERTLGFKYGGEIIRLTADQSGLPAHTHNVPYDQAQADANTRAPNMLVASLIDAGTANLVTSSSIAQDAAQPFSIIQPSTTIRFIIKT